MHGALHLSSVAKDVFRYVAMQLRSSCTPDVRHTCANASKLFIKFKFLYHQNVAHVSCRSVVAQIAVLAG